MAANSAFDRITYDKGQAVIGMMEAYRRAETAFRDGGAALLPARHAYRNTVSDDLWGARSKSASGKPVRATARAFTDQPGVPLLTRGRGLDRRPSLRLTRPSRFT